MLKKKMQGLKFRFHVAKLKYRHMKLMKVNLKILEVCLRYVNKIGVPVTESEKEDVKKMLSVYDDAIEDINEDINRVRKLVE